MNLFPAIHRMVLSLGLSAAALQATTAVQAYGQLKVQGTQILSQAGDPAVLRGMSLYWSLPAWGNSTQFWNASVIKWLADDWHANVVRAAMGVEPSGGYLSNPTEQKAYVSTVVDAAIAKGIYVIIDWHDANASSHEASAVQFFQEMATKYGKYPNVIYEVFNEPDDESWATVKRYSTKVIDAIRAIDPDNLILVGSPQWDQAVRSPADDPITGRANIAYTLHFYAGTHTDALRAEANYALTKIPLFISEWGTSNADGNGGPFTASSDTWLSWADQNKLSWCNWSVHNLSESSAALTGSASPTGNWNPTSDLSASGQYVRTKMRAANPTADGYTGGVSSSSSSVVSSSSSTPVSSSSVLVSSSSVSSSSSAILSSSSQGTSTCIAFVNGTGNYGANCYKSGMNYMVANTCYTMNPLRTPAPTWINGNANDAYWWVTAPCGATGSSSSSQPISSSSSVLVSSSSIAPSSSSVLVSSSSSQPVSSSSSMPVSSSSIAASSSSVLVSSSSSTPSSSSSAGTGLCQNPVLYTGGSIDVGPSGLCLKVNASSYLNGVMASVRNNGTAYTQATWFGGNDQNVTACAQTQKSLQGNGAQFNNFVIGKDGSGYSYLFVKSTDANTYSVIVDMQNWQNGNGCSSVVPPLARRLVPIVHALPGYFGLNGTQISPSTATGAYFERDSEGQMHLRAQLR